MQTLKFVSVILGGLSAIGFAVVKMEKGHKDWKTTRK
tara:strand:- start:62 stop:172 length:111 start_codon:yes stop_codon:yes gene_type:complete